MSLLLFELRLEWKEAANQLPCLEPPDPKQTLFHPFYLLGSGGVGGEFGEAGDFSGFSPVSPISPVFHTRYRISGEGRDFSGFLKFLRTGDGEGGEGALV
jgi:hypothetical protein